MRREYPEAPLVGVGAVVIDCDRVLLVQRGQDPGKGSWSIPGGLVELGENVADALRREVAEETGLEVEPGPLVGIFEPITKDAQGKIRFHYIVVDFLASLRSGTLRAASDVADVRWAMMDSLESYHLRQATVDMIQRARLLVTNS